MGSHRGDQRGVIHGNVSSKKDQELYELKSSGEGNIEVNVESTIAAQILIQPARVASMSSQMVGDQPDAPMTNPSYRTSTSRCEGGVSWADVEDDDGDEFFAAVPLMGYSNVGQVTYGINGTPSKPQRHENDFSSRRDSSEGYISRSGRTTSGYFRNNSGPNNKRERRLGGGNVSLRDDTQSRYKTRGRNGGLARSGTRDAVMQGDRNLKSTGAAETRSKQRKNPIVSIVDGEEWQEVPVTGNKRREATNDLPPGAADMWETGTEHIDEAKSSNTASEPHDTGEEIEQTDESEDESDSPTDSRTDDNRVVDVTLSNKTAEIRPDTTCSATLKCPPMTKQERREAKQNELEALNAVLYEFAITDSPGSDSTAVSLAKQAPEDHLLRDGAPGLPADKDECQQNSSKTKKKKTRDKAGLDEADSSAVDPVEENVPVVTLNPQEAAAKARERLGKKSGGPAVSGSIIAAVASEAKKKKQAAADAARRKLKKEFQFGKPK